MFSTLFFQFFVGDLGEVHMKTPGLYEVTKLISSQKTKKGENVEVKGVRGLGVGAGGIQGLLGKVHAKTIGLY